MFKFQQNRTKPHLIRILLVTSLYLVDSTKKDKPTFQSKQSRTTAWELKIEWENLFRTFLRRFTWKNDLGRLQKKTKKKERQCEEPIIYSICGLCHFQVIKSLVLDNFSLRSQEMVPNYFLYSYKISWIPSPKDLAPIFEQIDTYQWRWPLRWLAY